MGKVAIDKFGFGLYNTIKERDGMIIYDGNLKDTTDKASEKYFEVNSIGVQKKSSFLTIRKNGRCDFSLFYVENGEYIFKKANDEICIKPGGFFIYRPFEEQKYGAYEKGTYFWLHFSGTSVSEIISDAEINDCMYFEGGNVSSDIVKLFGKALFDFNAGEIGREAIITADVIAIIAMLGREPYREKSGSDERFEAVIYKMHRDFAKNTDVDEYARECGLSKSRFIHAFSEKMGRSPYAYLISLRLERAKELLLETKIPISQIAYEIGFSDPLNFSRIFKKYHGASPGKYRKSSVDHNFV